MWREQCPCTSHTIDICSLLVLCSFVQQNCDVYRIIEANVQSRNPNIWHSSIKTFALHYLAEQEEEYYQDDEEEEELELDERERDKQINNSAAIRRTTAKNYQPTGKRPKEPVTGDTIEGSDGFPIDNISYDQIESFAKFFCKKLGMLMYFYICVCGYIQMDIALNGKRNYIYVDVDYRTQLGRTGR